MKPHGACRTPAGLPAPALQSAPAALDYADPKTTLSPSVEFPILIRTGVDYKCPEGRGHILALICELFERFEIDGVELDNMRHPAFFRPEEANACRYLMIGFIRRIRLENPSLKERPMNSYERVQTAIRHEQPDRPPMHLMATEEYIALLRAHLGAASNEELLSALGVDLRLVKLDVDKAQAVPEAVARAHGADAQLSATSYGVVLKQEENFPQAQRVWGPLYDTDDLDSFDWPTASDVPPPETVSDEVDKLNAKGLCTVVRCDNPVKVAYFMRPFDEFLIDCIQRPAYARELLERIAEVEFTSAENGVRAGCRAAMIFGDFADQRSLMMSPPTFREVLKPVLADYVSRLRAIRPDVLVFLHSDGNLTDVLEDLIECGLDAVHPIQPESMDMLQVKRTFGSRLTLFGGVSVQSELPGSRPEDIRKLVRRRIDELAGDGGFMLAPSNTLLPDCPTESVVAMFEEGRRQV